MGMMLRRHRHTVDSNIETNEVTKPVEQATEKAEPVEQAVAKKPRTTRKAK